MNEIHLELTIGILYLAVAMCVLARGYHSTNWYVSSQRGEELKDIFACYTVAIAWPFFGAIKLIFWSFRYLHKLMVEATK